MPINIDAGRERLLDSKIGSLEKTASGYRKADGTLDLRKLEKAARGFESIFLNMIFKESKKSADVFGEKEDSDFAFGFDILEDYSYMSLADALSRNGEGFGIAKLIYETISGQKLPERRDVLKTVPAKKTKTAEGAIRELKALARSKIGSSLPRKASTSARAAGGRFIDRVLSRLSKYEDAIEEAAEKYEVPKELIKAVATAESAGLPNARSKAGAKGLMQLMDSTAKALGVLNPYDPRENILGGAKYLRNMLDKFGDLKLALAAYNAGPGAVSKYGGVPPYRETRAYVKKVADYYDLYKNMAENE